MSITNFKRIESIGPAFVDVNTVSANTYTISATDVGDMIKFTSNDTVNNVTVTIPKNSDVYIPVGTTITFMQYGDGIVRITPATGVAIVQEPAVSITTPNLIRTKAKYSRVQLTKISTDEWLSDGYGIYVQLTAPTNPQVNDLWFW